MEYRIVSEFAVKCAFRVSILILALAPAAMGAAIPGDRSIAWQGNVGVPGGIPNRTTVYTTLSPNGSDDTSAIQSALSSCPANQVVKLGSGTFRVSGIIDWQIVNDGVVLRGSGPDKTTVWLLDGYFYFRRQFSEESLSRDANLSQNAVKGSDTITLSSVPTWVKVDHLYILDQLDDPSFVSGMGTEGGESYRGALGNGDRGLAQLVKVKSKTATTITFYTPVSYSFSTARQAQIAGAGYDAVTGEPLRGCGLEDFTVEGKYSDERAIHTLKMESCDGCWVKNVVSLYTPGGCHIQGNFSYRCEVRDSTFSFGHNYDAGRAYGVAWYNVCSGCLVENNIMEHLHVAMMNCYGSSGNVFGYNYAIDSFGDTPGGGQAPSISTHGVHPYMNLWEGNYCDNKVLGDWIHGSASHNTIFRNRLLGYGNAMHNDETAVSIEMNNRKWNVVGNVLGVAGWHTFYEKVAPASGTELDRTIYKLGYAVNWACDSDPYDAPSVLDLLRHGNYDYTTQSTKWDASITDHNLPNSLYLASKPSFFGGLPWPAFGPDLSPMVGEIPAKRRFLGQPIPGGGPTLGLAPAILTFTTTVGGATPATQTVTVANSGTADVLSWTQSKDAAWLTATPASGSTPGTLTISVNPTGLAVGSYAGTITVTAPGADSSPQTLAVSLAVTPPPTPTLALSPANLTFAAIVGDAAPAAQTVAVANSGTADVLNWSQSDDAAWLTVTPAGGTTPGILSLSVDHAGLAPGTYTGTVTVTAPGASNTPRTITVALSVAVVPVLTGHYDMTYANRAALMASGWDFMARTASGAARNTEQTTGATVSYDQTTHPGVVRIPCDSGDLWGSANSTKNSLFRDLPADWTSVKIKLAAFAPSQNFQQAGIVVYENDDTYVQVYRTYEDGDHVGFVREANGDASTIASVVESATSGLHLQLVRDPANQSITASYSKNGTTWTPLGAITQPLENPRAGIVVTASPSGFPTADVAWFEVYGEASPPGTPHLSLSPAGLTFAAQVGGSAPAAQAVTVANTGSSSALSWAHSDNAAWLLVGPASGTTPGSLQVSVNPAGLAAGTYSGTISVSAAGADNTPQTLIVTLTVTAEQLAYGRFDMTYTDRASLLAAGWDFLAVKPTGAERNTENATGAVISYDQTAHPGVLRIPCDSGDLWASANNTKNTLFRDLPIDWTSVKMKLATFAPVQNYQQAGIVVYQDDDNYVQVYRTYEDGNRVGLVREVAAAATTIHSVPDNTTTGIYMRLVRDVDTQNIGGSYSLDNETWVPLNNVIQPLANPRIGIVVTASPGGLPNADVAWVEVHTASAAPLKTPMPPTNLRVVP